MSNVQVGLVLRGGSFCGAQATVCLRSAEDAACCRRQNFEMTGPPHTSSNLLIDDHLA
jgi:hypothetical protein